MIALSLLCSLRAEIFINLKIKSSPCHRTFRPPVFSVSPHRRQPTRLPHPWDSPGKNYQYYTQQQQQQKKKIHKFPTLGSLSVKLRSQNF